MITVSWHYHYALHSEIKIKIKLNDKTYFNSQNAPKANRHGMRALKNHAPDKTINLPKTKTSYSVCIN